MSLKIMVSGKAFSHYHWACGMVVAAGLAPEPSLRTRLEEAPSDGPRSLGASACDGAGGRRSWFALRRSLYGPTGERNTAVFTHDRSGGFLRAIEGLRRSKKGRAIAKAWQTNGTKTRDKQIRGDQ